MRRCLSFTVAALALAATSNSATADPAKSAAFGAAMQAGATTIQTAPQSICPTLHPSKVVNRLSDLPPEIRHDLTAVYKDMGEPDSQLMHTDSPTSAENRTTSRFAQGVLIRGEWLVQYELTYGGKRTLGYITGTDGHYQRFASHYFGGPFCETLNAIATGVSTPGGLNFK